jgi:hypothetical protein
MLRESQWVKLSEADSILRPQLSRLKRARHAGFTSDTVAERPKRHVLSFIQRDWPSMSQCTLRVVARNESDTGHACSDAVTACTTQAHASSLDAHAQAQLRGLFEQCACSEYYERFASQGYDAETLSRLPPAELNTVLDGMHVFPKHRDVLRAALAPNIGAPSALRKLAVSSDSITVVWDAPEMCGYPLLGYVVQWWRAGDEERAHVHESRGSATCMTFNNLVAGTSHVFRVAACSSGPKGQGQVKQLNHVFVYVPMIVCVHVCMYSESRLAAAAPRVGYE